MHLWLNQGFSSQRDLALLIKQASPDVVLSLTHKDDRKEILNCSDTTMPREPTQGGADEYLIYVEEVLELASKLGEPVTAMLAQRHRFNLVGQIEAFKSRGIRLATGSISKESLDLCEDKWAFTQAMAKAGVPVPNTRVATTYAEALVAIDELKEAGHYPVCVKPSVGVYGAGFWVLTVDADGFDIFADPEARSVMPHAYLEAFKQRIPQDPHIFMEYLPGAETSVDAVCDNGTIVSHACRTKFDGFQYITTHGEEYELAIRVAELCKLDGLINIQFKIAADLKPRLLEVNTRASGGVGYSSVAGINLANDLKKMLHGEKIEQVRLSEPVVVKPVNGYIRL
jgi:carbamoylphosphate synthase large subunit